MLLPGDRIATVSPSWGGPGALPHRYEAGKRQLEAEFGVTVVESRYACADPDWVYRNPKARADDLMQCFEDSSIQGIISTIGGEDTIRLLPYLDLSVIERNPKVFMGYSDTTVCHFACYKAGLVSFYGPSILSGFAENGGLMPYMRNSVQRTLFQSDPVGVIPPNTDGWTVEFLDWGDPGNQSRPRILNQSTGWRWLQGEGTVEGHLIGGCLEVVDGLRGTDYWPALAEWDNAILFLETSEDAPSPARVLHVLRSLEAVGVLSRINGLLFARPGGQLSESEHPAYDEVLIRAIRIEGGHTHMPVISNMDFGHTDPIMTLPYGIEAQINCETRTFSILESAVVAE